MLAATKPVAAVLTLLSVPLVAGLWSASEFNRQSALTEPTHVNPPAPQLPAGQAFAKVTSRAQLYARLGLIAEPQQRRLLVGAQQLFKPTSLPQNCVAVQLPETVELASVLELFADFSEHPQAKLGWCFQGHFGELVQASVRGHINFVSTQRAYAKANSIQLPSDASVDLLAHELAHIAGLADEYAMREPLAQNFCQGRYNHPSLNVVVTNGRYMSASELQALWQQLPWQEQVTHWQQLAQPTAQGWKLGSSSEQKFGLFPADTCKQVGLFAWKPVAETTAMQHFDVPKWPQLYLDLMQNYLSETLQSSGNLGNHDHGAGNSEKPNQ
ncbi:MAG: hypothetical protein WEA82_09140 [Idiomarina sp.]